MACPYCHLPVANPCIVEPDDGCYMDEAVIEPERNAWMFRGIFDKPLEVIGIDFD